MRIVLIGGTRFLGPPVVRQLHALGHEVTLFHRGRTQAALPEGVRVLHGDRKELPRFREEFRRLEPDVAVDLFAYRAAEARGFLETFRGIVPRAVVLSSCDVYLAFGRLHRTERGPPQPMPLTEESRLRATNEPHGEAYDKVGVEVEVTRAGDPPAAILRLPAIYGPGDPQHRLFPYLRRMDDGRPAILLDEPTARWRWARGYVDNVAAAVVLAAVKERSQGRIYNVAEPEAMEERTWVDWIARAADWNGVVEVVPPERLPPHLRSRCDFTQDFGVDSYRIRQELGYREVVPRDEALRRTVAWERANPPAEVDPREFDYAAEDAALA